MNKLQNYLNDYVQKLDGDWSYLICNLKNPQETICLNENHLHKSASMIKVLILATLCASDLDFNEKSLLIMYHMLKVVAHYKKWIAIQKLASKLLLV